MLTFVLSHLVLTVFLGCTLLSLVLAGHALHRWSMVPYRGRVSRLVAANFVFGYVNPYGTYVSYRPTRGHAVLVVALALVPMLNVLQLVRAALVEVVPALNHASWRAFQRMRHLSWCITDRTAPWLAQPLVRRQFSSRW